MNHQITEHNARCNVVMHQHNQPKVAEILADPYKGKFPLAGVNAFQEPFASCQVIQQKTSNIRRANQYLKHTETHMKYSFPPIATE
jgi:hypothetical protein